MTDGLLLDTRIALWLDSGDDRPPVDAYLDRLRSSRPARWSPVTNRSCASAKGMAGSPGSPPAP